MPYTYVILRYKFIMAANRASEAYNGHKLTTKEAKKHIFILWNQLLG